MSVCRRLVAPVALLAARMATAQAAAPSETDLAKKAQNPVSDLINLPFEFDGNVGSGQYERPAWTMNIQPVVPLKLSSTWNLIPRFILPITNQPVGTEDRRTGLGDSTLALFLSPQAPESLREGSFIWGVGPVALLPTATSPLLGTQEWGLGPTTALVWTEGPWVVSALAQNIWSFTGSINQFLRQSVGNYNFDDGWSVNLSSDIAADWTKHGRLRWTVDVGPGVGRTFYLGKQAMSASFAAKPYVVKPLRGSEWVLQLTLSALFPQ